MVRHLLGLVTFLVSLLTVAAPAAAEPGYLGIGGRYQDGGFLVESFPIDSPAQQAGLQVGDVLVTLNGQTFGSDQEVYDLVSRVSEQDRVVIDYFRDGRVATVEFLAAAAAPEAARESRFDERRVVLRRLGRILAADDGRGSFRLVRGSGTWEITHVSRPVADALLQHAARVFGSDPDIAFLRDRIPPGGWLKFTVTRSEGGRGTEVSWQAVDASDPELKALVENLQR